MDAWTAIGLCYLAGLAMPAGGLVALFERVGSRWLETELRHSVMAFGGGALISAVALVLVPEGGEAVGLPWAPAWLALGALGAMALDVRLARNRTPMGQLMAMLTDFLPESLALGAAVAAGSGSGAVIALMIGLQNLPEGFNAFRELRDGTSLSAGRLLLAFNLLALLGPAAAALGYFVLAPHRAAVGAIELVAAGGILYLIFQDIAPQAKLERAWAPPFGAVLGFALGMVGDLAIGG